MIEDLCVTINTKTLQQLGVDAPNRDAFDVVNREFSKEKGYSIENLRLFLDDNKPLMTCDQLNVFNSIMDSVKNGSGDIFFLDAPGGTGKTFLINLILAEVRCNEKIALAVASSGIAATLLEGGRTAHSAFKLPLDVAITEKVTCNISKSSGKGKVLKECTLIVWDECTMSHRKSLEALDETLRDFRNNDLHMGGVVILLAGDFRQTLPVIPRSTPADELNACLKKSLLWRHVQTLTLKTNMRVRLLNEPGASQFADNLLKIGSALHPFNLKFIEFPEDFCTFVQDTNDLINAVFPDICLNYLNKNWLCERAILAPTNDDVSAINV